MNPFLDLPGAIESDDTGVASHYGSPLAEQRALEMGTAIVDLSHRGIVTVSGPDRLSWLHSMTSQQLQSLRLGESTETLLLDPNGRIEHAMRVVDDGETAWLLVDEGEAEDLAAFLNRMRFALCVEVADVSDDFVTVLAFAPGSSEVSNLATAMLEEFDPVVVWRDPWREVTPGGVQYAHGEHPGAGWSAQQFVFPRAALAGIAEAIRESERTPTVTAAGLLALDALEIRAARPSLHNEVDARAIPHEFDWMRTAVHLTKGCYRGQETVAKVHNLGHPPRRLALLHLDGAGGELPAPGALVYPAGDPEARPVGRVTRAAIHHEWGGIALALLKRAAPEDAALEVELSDDRAAAKQEVIVPADAGKSREIPRFNRAR